MQNKSEKENERKKETTHTLRTILTSLRKREGEGGGEREGAKVRERIKEREREMNRVSQYSRENRSHS